MWCIFTHSLYDYSLRFTIYTIYDDDLSSLTYLFHCILAIFMRTKFQRKAKYKKRPHGRTREWEGEGRNRGVNCLEAEKSIFVLNISFKALANSAGVCLLVCEENDWKTVFLCCTCEWLCVCVHKMPLQRANTAGGCKRYILEFVCIWFYVTERLCDFE